VPALGVRVQVDDEGEGHRADQPQPRRLLGAAEETAKAQAGNWFHTGDGGYLDDEATWSSPTARRT